jgi:hypothetical protein
MKLANLLLLLMLGAIGISCALAQDTTSDSKGKTKTRTITGCLSKGDSANEFDLRANDGSTWELKSDQVALADHVGHTVSVTGVVSNAKMHNLKEDAKDTAKDAGIKKENTEHGHITVTNVRMVSSSCSQ